MFSSDVRMVSVCACASATSTRSNGSRVPTLRGDGETRSSEHRWFTLKNALVVFQVAVSVVLLGGTSIFLQILSASRTVRAGFSVDGVAMLETDARYAGLVALRRD